MREISYEEYIGRSPRWQEKRVERLKIDNFKCVVCGETHNLHVHHITYENLGNEDVDNDLVTLCKGCHMKIEYDKAVYDPKQRALIITKTDYEERDEKRRIEEEHRMNVKSLVDDYFDEFVDVCSKCDYAYGGKYDFTNYSEIKRSFKRFWLKKTGSELEYEDLIPTSDLHNEFIKMRVGRIHELRGCGASVDDIARQTSIPLTTIKQHY